MIFIKAKQKEWAINKMTHPALYDHLTVLMKVDFGAPCS